MGRGNGVFVFLHWPISSASQQSRTHRPMVLNVVIYTWTPATHTPYSFLPIPSWYWAFLIRSQGSCRRFHFGMHHVLSLAN